MHFPYTPPIFLSSLIVVILSFSNNGSYLLICFDVKILREKWKRRQRLKGLVTIIMPIMMARED